LDFASLQSVNYIRDILRYRGVNYPRARLRDHFRVNNNIRLTDMQIFIVYAHIHDLIVPVQIIIRFYPLAREETLRNLPHERIAIYKYDFQQ